MRFIILFGSFKKCFLLGAFQPLWNLIMFFLYVKIAQIISYLFNSPCRKTGPCFIYFQPTEAVWHGTHCPLSLELSPSLSLFHSCSFILYSATKNSSSNRSRLIHASRCSSRQDQFNYSLCCMPASSRARGAHHGRSSELTLGHISTAMGTTSSCHNHPWPYFSRSRRPPWTQTFELVASLVTVASLAAHEL